MFLKINTSMGWNNFPLLAVHIRIEFVFNKEINIINVSGVYEKSDTSKAS